MYILADFGIGSVLQRTTVDLENLVADFRIVRIVGRRAWVPLKLEPLHLIQLKNKLPKI